MHRIGFLEDLHHCVLPPLQGIGGKLRNLIQAVEERIPKLPVGRQSQVGVEFTIIQLFLDGIQ